MKLTSAKSNNTCENTIFSVAEISTTEPPSVDKHFLPNPSNDHFSLDKEDPPEGPVLTHINTTWCGPYIIRVLQCRRRSQAHHQKASVNYTLNDYESGLNDMFCGQMIVCAVGCP
ncbi:hypothetical protein WN51_11627 [Melipona quadrifasciata]|uniref:Uncharacterized protein n=1 Tax=Melipona quadrifasciata TaxID=166423 RepID=A0A0M9A4H7_9HYME|nr:hypothetical protein WN51_11627 [Melipona quadrifasciata]